MSLLQKNLDEKDQSKIPLEIFGDVGKEVLVLLGALLCLGWLLAGFAALLESRVLTASVARGISEIKNLPLVAGGFYGEALMLFRLFGRRRRGAR